VGKFQEVHSDKNLHGKEKSQDSQKLISDDFLGKTFPCPGMTSLLRKQGFGTLRKP
jgi:hypothetical protein